MNTADTANTPLERLKSYWDSPAHAELRDAAYLSDPMGSAAAQAEFAQKMLDDAKGRLAAAKSGNPRPPSVAASARLIASYPGVNDVQRAIAYLSEKQPGFAKLDWGRQNFLADRFLATGRASE
ncbi:MAG TPA: hypothetical protein VFQ35_23870 [Polyangiaceae bacterium]|jgi:hypothetical protein|nr:hypothetical protein [Polyangiaceae bacterium]